MDNKNVEKKRIVWLDALKGLAMIQVVLGHVLLGYTENYAFPLDDKWMTILMKWIYTWHMPMFIMLSGISFSLSMYCDNKVNRNKIKRQIINLLLLYIIFSIALGVLKIFFSNYVDNRMNVKGLFVGILLPDTIMWYLWVLIIYYIIMIVIERFFLNHTRLVIFISFLVFLITKFISYYVPIRFCINNLVSFFVFFQIGLHIKDVYKNIKRNIKMLVVIFALFATIFYFSAFLLEKDVEIMIVGSMLSFLIPISLLLIFTSFDREYIIINKLGYASLIIYLVHTYVVTAIKAFVIRTHALSSGCVATVVTTLLGILFPYYVYVLSKKIIAIKYLFSPILLFDKYNKRVG